MPAFFVLVSLFFIQLVIVFFMATSDYSGQKNGAIEVTVFEAVEGVRFFGRSNKNKMV
jgi:hypothetical protein